jgi:hypothetical protein
MEEAMRTSGLIAFSSGSNVNREGERKGYASRGDTPPQWRLSRPSPQMKQALLGALYLNQNNFTYFVDGIVLL